MLYLSAYPLYLILPGKHLLSSLVILYKRSTVKCSSSRYVTHHGNIILVNYGCLKDVKNMSCIHQSGVLSTIFKKRLGSSLSWKKP